MTNNNWNKTTSLTMLGMFTAIIFLLNAIPMVGRPILPIVGISATTLHIPVIVGSLVLGPKYGAILGFVFGAVSVFNATTLQVPSSFMFSPFVEYFGGIPRGMASRLMSLVVAFGPRILVGVVPWYVYHGLEKLTFSKVKPITLAITAAVGSLTNTVLVMGLWLIMFREPWAAARALNNNWDTIENFNALLAVVVGIVSTVGLAEAFVAAVAVPAVCIALFSVKQRIGARA